VLAVVIVIICFTQWNRWQGEARYQTTDDAYLQTDLTPLSAQVQGYVRAVPVQDYDHVRAGQLIVEIVDDNYRATVAQAQANPSGPWCRWLGYLAARSAQPSSPPRRWCANSAPPT
jgi:membrane fusion protein (multidrug efflux system)